MSYLIKYIETPRVLTEKGNSILTRSKMIERKIKEYLTDAKRNKSFADFLILISEQQDEIMQMLEFIKSFAEDLAKDKSAIEGAAIRDRLKDYEAVFSTLVKYREEHIKLVARINKNEILKDYLNDSARA